MATTLDLSCADVEIPGRPDVETPTKLSRAAVFGFVLVCVALACSMPAWREFYLQGILDHWSPLVTNLWVAGLIVGTLALVVSIIAERMVRRPPTGGRKLADAALLLCLTGLGLNVVMGLVGGSNSISM